MGNGLDGIHFREKNNHSPQQSQVCTVGVTNAFWVRKPNMLFFPLKSQLLRIYEAPLSPKIQGTVPGTWEDFNKYLLPGRMGASTDLSCRCNFGHQGVHLLLLKPRGNFWEGEQRQLSPPVLICDLRC